MGAEIDYVSRPGEGLGEKRRVGFTLVISAVAASISRSSAVRSVKPGRACLACNLSRALTRRAGKEANKPDKRMRMLKEAERIARVVRTFELCVG